jgi:hypothetical protein
MVISSTDINITNNHLSPQIIEHSKKYYDFYRTFFWYVFLDIRKGMAGVDPGGRVHLAYAPPKIGKNKIFWREIAIFHTKYPKKFRASLRSAQFF